MDQTALTEQEVQQFRAETKGTQTKIHFNNAGSSLPPDVVVETVINYLKEEALCGGYETEFKYREELSNTYNLIARLLNAQADEIALVENASVGWSLAFHGLTFEKGDEIITSEMEYVTNVLGFLSVQKTYGVEIKVIPNDEHGNFSLSALEDDITPQTKLIAVTHISSTAGVMLPIVEIGKIASKHKILYLVDACQSAGHVPLDVKEIGCDMVSVTGRKYLRAPRGTGFLYIRKETQDKLKPLFMDGASVNWVTTNNFEVRADARRFELYERNRALTLGLAVAVNYALNIGVDKIWQRIKSLADLMRIQLREIQGVTVHDTGDQQCGIVTFSVNGIDSIAVKDKLFEKQINVSVGPAKSTPYYMAKHQLATVARASVHYYNTEEEINVMCKEIALLTKSNQSHF